jgi:hypothetical protein
MKELVVVVRGFWEESDVVQIMGRITDCVPEARETRASDTDTPEAQIALMRARAELEERLWTALRRDP